MRFLLTIIFIVFGLAAFSQANTNTRQVRFFQTTVASDTAETIANDGRMWYDFTQKHFRVNRNGTNYTLASGTLLPDVFFVDEYGAVADSDGTTGNGTDNSAALTSAVAAVVANGGGILVFGKGIYRTTTALPINGNNITVTGYGMGKSTIFFDSTTDNIWMNLNGNYNNITQITLKGRQVFTSTGHLLVVRGNDIVVEKVEMTNSNCFGIQVANGTATSNVIVKDCYSHDHAADGMHVSGNASFVKFLNNHIYNCADDGIGVGYEGPANNIVISNNTIYQTSAGIALMGYSSGSTTALVRDIEVVGNVIENTWLQGIVIYASQGSIARLNITSNVIYNAGMWTPPGSLNMRGSGYAGGIVSYKLMASASHFIANLNIVGNTIGTPRNFAIAIGLNNGGTTGITQTVAIENNVCSYNATVGGAGAAGGTGGGNSITPALAQYPLILVEYVTNEIKIANNLLRSASWGYITLGANANGYITVSNNDGFLGNTSNSSTAAYLYNNPDNIISTHNSNRGATNPFTTARSITGSPFTALLRDAFLFRNSQAGTTYTVTSNDQSAIIGLTNTAARTITFPLASTYVSGMGFTLSDEGGNAGTNAITYNRAGSDLINGATSGTINTNYGSRTFYSNGTNAWYTRN